MVVDLTRIVVGCTGIADRQAALASVCRHLQDDISAISVAFFPRGGAPPAAAPDDWSARWTALALSTPLLSPDEPRTVHTANDIPEKLGEVLSPLGVGSILVIPAKAGGRQAGTLVAAIPAGAVDRIAELSLVEQLLPVACCLALLEVAHESARLKAAEETIAELSDFNQKVIEQCPGAILVYERGGRCVLANEAAARSVGTTREWLLTTNFRELDSWKECRLLTLALDCLDDNAPQHEIIHMKTTFGRDAWFDCRLAPFTMKNQQHLLLSFDDITEQEQALASLKENETRFRTALRDLPVGIALVDQQGGVRYLNHCLVNTLGWTMEEVPDLESFWERALPDEQIRWRFNRRWARYYKRAQRNGAAIPTQEYEVNCKDGLSRTVEIFGLPMGELVMIVLNDITARKSIEESLRQSEEQYRNFIADSSESIWRYKPDYPIPLSLPIDQQIDWIFRYVRVAECNDTYARQSGYRDAEEMVGKYLREFFIPETLPALETFVKGGYEPAGLEYRRTDSAGNEHWYIASYAGCIKDDCVVGAWGIERDITERKQMERALMQANEPLQEPLNKLEEANVNLDARVLERTVRLLENDNDLRADKEAADAASRAKSESLAIKTPSCFRGKVVLVVEDNEINREAARHVLEIQGITVKVAVNGAEVVDQVCNQGLRPDLILMDLQMPVMDGYEATRRIREQLGAGAPPVAAMTAHALAEEVGKCAAAGMVAHLSKPLDWNNVAALLVDRPGNSHDRPADTGATAAKDPMSMDCAPDQLSMSDSGNETDNELLQMFYQSAPLEIKQLRAACRLRDHNSFLAYAHSLKGACATVHAGLMWQICSDLEAAAREQDWDSISALLDKWDAEIKSRV